MGENGFPERYKPLQKFSGGFSDVMECKDGNLDRKVAIKSIKDLSESDRMQDEIHSLLTLRSKHVIQVFDLIPLPDNTTGIVLEFVEGKDLFNIDVIKLSNEERLSILWQISSGLSDIHDAGIIHRDIKPNNMKLDGEGILKIFDFGLSRETGEDASTHGFKGTIGFAAPELFTNERVEFTKAVDIYAFGAIVCYLFFSDLLDELNQVPPIPLSSNPLASILSNNYPKLARLLGDCLDHNPDHRPPIKQIRDELERSIVKGRHQALAIMGGKSYLLDQNHKKATIKVNSIGSFNLVYDELRFYITHVAGDVFMNNIKVKTQTELVGSCVITFGDADMGKARHYLTIDPSNPEVTL